MTTSGRILVVKLSALGDLFHAVPVVHRLAEHYGVPVDWVTQPEYASLVACHRDVGRVLAFPRRGGLREWRNFARDLRREHYDLVFDLQGLSKSGLVTGLSRGTRKIGLRDPREGSGWFAHEIPKRAAEDPHAMERLFDSLRHAGIEPEPVEFPLDFPEGPELNPDRRSLALAPWSRWPAKNWPEENFIQLARELTGELELDIHILGGGTEREAGTRMAEAIGPAARSRCGELSLPELGGFLKRVGGLVCNDSGPMHMAAAVGTPLVALFGPTDPALTGPWGRAYQVLRPPPGPEGYPVHRSYKTPDTTLIRRLSVDEVKAAVKEQIFSLS